MLIKGLGATVANYARKVFVTVRERGGGYIINAMKFAAAMNVNH